MKQDALEEAGTSAEEIERRSKLMERIIISVGSPVFAGWGPRIANVAEILRTLN